jgi:hypothetical protein
VPDMPGVSDDAAGLRAANARLRELLAERDAELAELRALVAGLQAQLADLAARAGQSPDWTEQCNGTSPIGRSCLEAGGFLRSAGGIAGLVGVRACPGQLATLNDQVFLTDRPVLKPAFQDLAGARGVAGLGRQRRT